MEKQKIDKFGKSIAIHHKKRIEYKEGDILGNNITFLRDDEDETRLKSKKSNKLVNFRQAMFRCYCGKEFEKPVRIDKIKMGKIKSCGCLRLEKLEEFHKNRKVKNEAQ